MYTLKIRQTYFYSHPSERYVSYVCGVVEVVVLSLISRDNATTTTTTTMFTLNRLISAVIDRLGLDGHALLCAELTRSRLINPTIDDRSRSGDVIGHVIVARATSSRASPSSPAERARRDASPDAHLDQISHVRTDYNSPTRRHADPVHR